MAMLHTLAWNWSFEPTVVVGLLVLAGLYVLGIVYTVRAGLSRRISAWRAAAFAAGLLSIFLALESPLDAWSDIYLWAHMIQHEILIYVAAPLLLLGAPLWPWWRAIPLEWRRSSLRWVMMHPRPRRLGIGIGRLLFSPRLAWAVFCGLFIAWHVPQLYDLALRDQVVHILEHLCFLAGGVLFWAQIIPSHPLRPRIGYMAQALYSFSAGMVTMLVALVLTFATTPIYSFYATEPRTKDMIPIMVDQTSAGGIMNLSGAILFGTLFMVLVGLWLGKDEEADDELLRYRHPHWRAIV